MSYLLEVISIPKAGLRIRQYVENQGFDGCNFNIDIENE